jgi:hypothetical protein
MALRVSLIKAVEQTSNHYARIILWEKFDGWDTYLTAEPYTGVRERLSKAPQSSLPK